MNSTTAAGQRYLSRKEASEYLKALGLPVAVRTLAKWAVHGEGPQFCRFNGRTVRYPRESLESWINEKVGPLRRSTSDKARLITS